MKYIENLELREWVKDSLKKTIFQKAHALAVQTGCDILVKLLDNADVTGCQYYATNNLRKLYRNSKLRQPGELLVSGETGLPHMDKCIQYEEEPTEDGVIESAMPEDNEAGENEDFLQNRGTHNTDGAVPMQITASTAVPATTDFSTPTTESEIGVQITQITNQRNLLGTQVKQEPTFQEPTAQEPTAQTSFSQSSPMMSMPPPAQSGQVGAYSYPISPKPYQCSICRKAFKSVHVLKKHTLTFHMPGGTIGHSRGRGRGSKSNRSRGRGRGTAFSRPPTMVQQQTFQASSPPPVIKPEDDQNRFTCIMCNQNFEESSQLNEHMSQCSMAPGALPQGGMVDLASNQFVTGTPAAAGSEDAAGFLGNFPQDTHGTNPATSWSLVPPAGSSGGGLNVSTAADYFGQQVPSAPTFVSPSQSPGQSPRASSGATSSRAKMKGVSLGQSANMTKRNLMAAILQTGGPVATTTAVTWAYRFLRMLTKQQFEAAAKDLQAAMLGTLVSSTNQRGAPSLVFVKKSPSEARPILEKHPDLCTPEYYAERFNMLVSKAVGKNTKKMTKSSSGILGQSAILSRRSIMAAILQTGGPVSTCQALRWNWKFLSSATVQQFQAAAVELEAANLGRLITLPSQKGRGVNVFVKKSPQEVCPQLEANQDLCTWDVYSTRYVRPASKSITWNIRSQLVNMGLVAQKQFM